MLSTDGVSPSRLMLPITFPRKPSCRPGSFRARCTLLSLLVGEKPFFVSVSFATANDIDSFISFSLFNPHLSNHNSNNQTIYLHSSISAQVLTRTKSFFTSFSHAWPVFALSPHSASRDNIGNGSNDFPWYSLDSSRLRSSGPSDGQIPKVLINERPELYYTTLRTTSITILK